MSLAEISAAVRKLSFDDESLQCPGLCRRTSYLVKKTAEDADRTPPIANVITYLAYPDSVSGEDVHYAVGLSSEEGDAIINESPASQFPLYIGDRKSAPGLLSKMRPVEKIA